MAVASVFWFHRLPASQAREVPEVLSEQQKQAAQALLDELLDLPEAGRWPRLRSREIGDPAIRGEVESLLRAVEATDGFLSKPARPPTEAGDEEIAVGMRLGAWRITGRVGRGGMGDVYKAARAEGDFEQRAAIKLLQQEASAQLERFQAERQILARLEHPGIARLYDGGIAPDGRPYMVMEFIEGRPITEYCAQHRSTLQERLELFGHVCEAVAYAHRNLVVHRDLKPSNILVTGDGQMKLLDFGIAKLIDAHRASLTQATDTVMTPMCAAPEQLSGKPVTTATDVYALGLLLFELLTGTHPWAGGEALVMQALRAAMQRPVPPPSRVAEARPDAPVPARLIRGDLDAIVSKTLREEPTHRYATVEALKLDIEHALRGEPVAARGGAKLYVFGRALRRYRWTAIAVLIIFLSLAGGLSVAAWQANRAEIERDAARRDAAREEAVRYSLTRLFRSAIAEQGAQPATAKSMIDTSAQRVLREYRDQPQLTGQIVLTLADLYGALEDVEGAGALLDGFVAQAAANSDPATLADARQKLANIEQLRGHSERAGKLLDQAEAFWASAPRLYAEERLEGLNTRATQQRTLGDLKGAIATSRVAIAQRIALSGRSNRETAVLYNTLAITLAGANQLEEARSAYQEAVNIYRSVGLGDGLDAQVIVANIGTLDYRIGRLTESETLLKGALERERALAGDSAAVAAAMGYFGKLQTIRNRPAQAVQVLRQAAEMGSRYAGANSPVALQNRQFLGEAQLDSGDIAGAQVTLAAAHEAAVKQFGPSHPLSLRTQVALARVAAASGHDPEAERQLGQAVSGLRKMGPQAEALLAQALEVLGNVFMAQKQTGQAIGALKESVTLREKSTYPGWELAEARERLGEAYEAVGNARFSAVLLKEAAESLEVQLGADHPETVRAKASLAQLRASLPQPL